MKSIAASPPPSDRRPERGVLRLLSRLALAVAFIAMLGLHYVQAALDPIEQPVSFYLHGEHGWLLTFALAAFGASAITQALTLPVLPNSGRVRASLALFGTGMILAALVPSDRSFPWEAQPPTLFGLVHAAVAVIAPPLLIEPMIVSLKNVSHSRRRILLLFLAAYLLGLFASGVSLATGFLHAGPPPLIGLAERILALSAVAWLAVNSRAAFTHHRST